MTHPIRRANPDDAAEIAECLAELGYGTTATLVVEKLRRAAHSAIDAVFVATAGEGKRIVGVASIHVLPLFHASGNLARLTALAVRRDSQRRGVGGALLTAAEEFAWASDCRRIEITSGDHRPEAHAFYRRLGYLEDERRFIKRAPDFGKASS